MHSKEPKIFITGATGYIGGRLLRFLTDLGDPCCCLVRRQGVLQQNENAEIELLRGDLLEPDSLNISGKGGDTAFYLVHSMGSKGNFVREDQLAAENFSAAARKAGVKRIIYLGGLGGGEINLSDHLNSRHEVGRILHNSNVQVIEFRASIIIDSGSLSCELVRALVERLPIMITPRCISVKAQPISINDVLDYLTAAIHIQVEGNPIFEIGGCDVVSYGGIMREYARQRGLRRSMIHVPFLTPYLSSLWLGLVTPVYARIGRKLIDSIRYPTVVTDDLALKTFKIVPRGIEQALVEASRNEDRDFAETRWADSASSSGSLTDWGGVRFGNRLVDSRELAVKTAL